MTNVKGNGSTHRESHRVSIAVWCACGQKFEAGDEFAGRRVKCPDCSRSLVIPRAVVDQPASSVASNPVDEYAAEMSTRAIFSAVLGLASFPFVFLAGIPAIIYGFLAISDINRSRGRLTGKWLALVGMSCGMLGSTTVTLLVVKPMVRRVLGEQNQAGCAKNLGEIALAIHKFVSERNRYPAAAITDRTGKPLLSWRVAMLPYLGRDSRQLYEEFHLDEPWDSPHNALLIPRMPAVFACPDEPTSPLGRTNYQVLVGPKTMFTGARKGFKAEEITDGTSLTIMVLEAANGVMWTAPDELTQTNSAPLWGIGGRHRNVFNVIFADGSVRTLPDAITPATLADMTTRSGGEVVTPPF